MAKKEELTVSQYLQHMGHALVEANIQSMMMLRETMASNMLDGDVPLCDRTIHMDGTTITPEGWFRMDELEIECESAVHVAHDDDGKAKGLAMSMKNGLFKKGMQVKFRAKFVRSGNIEAIEILRDAGNDALRKHLTPLPLKIQVTDKEETING